MPTLKLVPDVPVFVKILDKIFEGKTPKLKEGEKAKDQKKAPMIFNVTNYVFDDKGKCTAADDMQLVAGAVVQSEIADTYEKESYVGKTFMLTKGKKKDLSGGRGYFTYEIAEIEAIEPPKSA
jgi:hypothetical protein